MISNIENATLSCSWDSIHLLLNTITLENEHQLGPILIKLFLAMNRESENDLNQKKQIAELMEKIVDVARNIGSKDMPTILDITIQYYTLLLTDYFEELLTNNLFEPLRRKIEGFQENQAQLNSCITRENPLTEMDIVTLLEYTNQLSGLNKQALNLTQLAHKIYYFLEINNPSILIEIMRKQLAVYRLIGDSQKTMQFCWKILSYYKQHAQKFLTVLEPASLMMQEAANWAQEASKGTTLKEQLLREIAEIKNSMYMENKNIQSFIDYLSATQEWLMAIQPESNCVNARDMILYIKGLLNSISLLMQKKIHANEHTTMNNFAQFFKDQRLLWQSFLPTLTTTTGEQWLVDPIAGKGDCGFDCLGVTRDEIADFLLSKADDVTVRERFVDAIAESFYSPQAFYHREYREQWQELYKTKQEQEATFDATLIHMFEMLPDFRSEILGEERATRNQRFLTYLTKNNMGTCLGVYHALENEILETQEAMNTRLMDRNVFVNYSESLRNGEWIDIKSMLFWTQCQNISLKIWFLNENGELKLSNYNDIPENNAQKNINVLFYPSGKHFDLLMKPSQSIAKNFYYTNNNGHTLYNPKQHVPKEIQTLMSNMVTTIAENFTKSNTGGYQQS